MDDTSMQSMNYLGELGRVFQYKCARTLTSCYVSFQLTEILG